MTFLYFGKQKREKKKKKKKRKKFIRARLLTHAHHREEHRTRFQCYYKR